MKRIKVIKLQKFADLDSIIESNKQAFEGVDIKGQYQGIAEKLQSLGYEVILNNKEKAEFIPSARLSEVVSQRETFKTQVSDLTKQLETMKTAAAGNEGLQRQLQEMIDANNKLSADLEATRVNTQILLEAKDAIDPNDVLLFVNKDNLKVAKDGSINGVKEEIERIKKEKPHLFNKTTSKGGMDNGGGAGEGNKFNMNNAIRRAAGKIGTL